MPKLEPGSIGYHAVSARSHANNVSFSRRHRDPELDDAIRELCEAIKELAIGMEKIERKLDRLID